MNIEAQICLYGNIFVEGTISDHGCEILFLFLLEGGDEGCSLLLDVLPTFGSVLKLFGDINVKQSASIIAQSASTTRNEAIQSCKSSARCSTIAHTYPKKR